VLKLTSASAVTEILLTVETRPISSTARNTLPPATIVTSSKFV
jgi:hypothetical protein